jgi:nucleoside diphosphate kinase
MIKPDAYTNFGKILDAIYKDGFEINKLKMSKFNDQSIEAFYGEHIGKPFFPNLSSHMQSDVVIGMSLTGSQAVQKWRNLIGPTNT